MSDGSSRILVWDLATRLFHWLFAGGFIAAAILSLALGEHSPSFPYHAIVGLTLVLMVVLRIVWGVIGSKYARFASFIYGPRSVIEYTRGVLTGKGRRHIGHNPGSSVAIFLMLLLMIVLGVTGVMMATGTRGIKEIHELASYAMLGVVGIHVLGVILHSVRHRENITASMVHGRKAGDPGAAIGSARPIAAGILLLVAGAWAFGLARNYDKVTARTTVPILGTSLKLGDGPRRGEFRGGERGERRDHREREEREEHDEGDGDD